jgi:hypothetical protein
VAKRNQILIGALIVQLLVVAIVFWPRPTASGTSGESLFADLEADQIVGLTVASADGQSIRLVKRPGGWVLPDADDYPCQEDKITPVLTKIADLTTDTLVTQTSGSHKRLGVAVGEFERRIDFQLADGSEYRLYLGTSPSFGATHIRADGQDEVYLISDLSVQDVGVQATAWVDRIYFSVPTEDVVAITLENGNGRFEFVKDGTQWTLAGLSADEALKSTMVESLVNRATSVSLLTPLGREEKDFYGLDEPKAIITIATQSEEAGEKTHSLRVGAKYTEDQSYVLASSDSAYYVRVTELTVQDWIEKTRDDFLELPPTPTPGTTPEATPSG